MTRTPLQASENSIKGERVHVEIGMNPKSVVPAVMEAGGGGAACSQSPKGDIKVW